MLHQWFFHALIMFFFLFVSPSGGVGIIKKHMSQLFIRRVVIALSIARGAALANALNTKRPLSQIALSTNWAPQGRTQFQSVVFWSLAEQIAFWLPFVCVVGHISGAGVMLGQSLQFRRISPRQLKQC